jgi:Mo-dependent nitrogenase C-terminus
MFIYVAFLGITIHLVSTPYYARLLAQFFGEQTIVPELPDYLLLETLITWVLEMIKPHRFDILQPLRQWIDRLPINNQRLASQVCEFIPAQCPFEHDLTIFGHRLIHIPPLCKLNPLYAELAALRWRALCYLADQAEPKLN